MVLTLIVLLTAPFIIILFVLPGMGILSPQPEWGFVSVGLILFGIFSLGLILLLHQRRKHLSELFHLRKEIQQMSSELLLAGERERRKIAMDIHDRIGQNLALSRKKLDLFRSQNSSGPILDHVVQMIDQAIDDTRSLTFDISPQILYDDGLEAALDWLCEQMGKDHGITMAFRDDLKPKPLSMDARILLFQSVRECVLNVVKHSQADQAWVHIKLIHNTLHIEVGDNGVGFDLESVVKKENRSYGLGLWSAIERIKHHGGDVHVESKLSQGTRIKIDFPLDRHV